MAKKLMSWKTKGMNKDLSVSAFNPEFAFDNMNLRLSTNEGNTLLSWVNERGTEQIKNSEGQHPVISLVGRAVGTAIINHKLVVFTTLYDGSSLKQNYSGDCIYKLEYSDKSLPTMTVGLLYSGDLNFDYYHPLETIVSYESENIQKVYWVDGKNQPRLINIAGDSVLTRDASYFDFVNELALNETITVKKLLGASGMFAPGVIQYAFTYYNKNGQETNIFYTTPLYYISNFDRGVSPDGKVENAFKINVTRVDNRFDYLRIYSIQRTSINGTPLCKRVQDIAVRNVQNNQTVSYTDTGLNGNNIDPTELLYKGGEAVIANTLEQKDNTLFLGNIKLTAKHKPDDISQIADKSGWTIEDSTRTFKALRVSSSPYDYSNQLTASPCISGAVEDWTVPCGGFKRGDKYRCGVQFQHITGKWSDPIWIADYPVSNKPSLGSDTTLITVPTLIGKIDETNLSTDKKHLEKLYNDGYRRARAVVVFPNMQDRFTLCQGVVNSTLYTVEHRNTNKDIHAQSSWFFRPQKAAATNRVLNGAVFPVDDGWLNYTNRDINSPGYVPEDTNNNIRSVEIQGDFDQNKNQFKIDKTQVLTLHSPDLEFDDRLQVVDYNNVISRKVGNAVFGNTLSDISIQTETPAISNSGTGFVHKAFTDSSNHGIVSGLFYEDWIVDDMGDEENFDHFERYNRSRENSPVKWMVYLWNKDGSLNNDINRPTNTGTPSAILKKKVISNLRVSNTEWDTGNVDTDYPIALDFSPQLFHSDEPTILKLGDAIYQGNIDTILIPDFADGMYFAFGGNTYDDLVDGNIATPFTSDKWWKTYSVDPDSVSLDYGLYRRKNNIWEWYNEDDYEVGKYYIDLISKKNGVRMKYKSTAHLVLRRLNTNPFPDIWEEMSLPIVEITKDPGSSIFGGTSIDAFMENTWIPCGEPVPIWEYNNGVPTPKSSVSFEYSYGDTYFQRWDCLKTYAYTPEDTNQIIEIGSFMLETHTNIDGRYDRNRGQINNLNISPRNFNLINPVYSQTDNFFTYKIMPEDAYKDTIFPNQITWSKTKESGADVDQWTNVTLASTLELDGDKGKLNKLIRLNDQILAFQDTGISQILYNENVQISSTDGVPIEIANSGKVQGKRYLSNTIGCSNKWSMTTTPAGIYFMDSHDKSIYLFNGQLQNLSNQGGFASWAKNNISLTGQQWSPNFSTSDFVTYYDKLNQDVLFINGTTALAWSEKLQAFTSFYSYENIPFFCNLDDTGIWIKNGESAAALWKHQAGNYCSFFDANNYSNKPYWMTLVGNPEPQMDKTFTNLEFRACVDGEGTTKVENSTTVFDKPFIPFDFLETWDEYQHGIAEINIRSGHNIFKHHDSNAAGSGATLIRKFRIWRCDIPRDNVIMTSAQPSASTPTTYTKDAELGITRYSRRPMDRMRNPWLYLKLMKNIPQSGTLPRTEIHDVVMTYFE